MQDAPSPAAVAAFFCLRARVVVDGVALSQGCQHLCQHMYWLLNILLPSCHMRHILPVVWVALPWQSRAVSALWCLQCLPCICTVRASLERANNEVPLQPTTNDLIWGVCRGGPVRGAAAGHRGAGARVAARVQGAAQRGAGAARRRVRLVAALAPVPDCL